jgi:hypothetical protein
MVYPWASLTIDTEVRVLILILGLNHQIQRPFWSSDRRALAFAQDQKERFAQLIREQIRTRNVRLVGEEANPAEESIAESICTEERCRYTNIDMPSDKRAERQIPPGYNENDTVPEAEKTRGNREREDYMVAKVLATGGECDSVLIICGRDHSEPLADFFLAGGHTVETEDLRNSSWYVEDWKHHIMHNL